MKKNPIPLTHRLICPTVVSKTLSNMLIGIFFLHKACKSDMDALEAFFTQAKRHLSQAASSIKYDTEICTFVNVFQLFPTDVKFVISSSIFTTSNEFRFFLY